MRGVPLRLEIGPRDIADDQCVLVRRDDLVKRVTPLGELETTVREQLDLFAKAIYDKARKNLESRIIPCTTIEEMKQALTPRANFVKAMWCGDEKCEIAIKEQTGMPTLCGLRRRGYTPQAIRSFCERIGVAKVASTVEYGFLEHCLREDLNLTAPRVMRDRARVRHSAASRALDLIRRELLL